MDNIREALKGMSAAERKNLLEELKAEDQKATRDRREAYEALRAQFAHEVKSHLLPLVEDVRQFREWIEKEADGFYSVMRDYGQLRKEEQSSFTIVDGDMKMEVRSNKVKTFDEPSSVSRELMLMKVKYNKNNRKDIMETCDIMGADIVDMSQNMFIIQICDVPERIRLFISMMKGISIVEMARTGTLALQKCLEAEE